MRVEDLQNRSDDKVSFEQAVVAAEALRSPAIPAQSNSGLWVDVNGKPLVAYFGEREFDGRVVCDGITVCALIYLHIVSLAEYITAIRKG